MSDDPGVISENVRISRQIIRAIERGEPNGFIDHLADNAVVTVMGDTLFSRSVTSKQSLKAAFMSESGETSGWQYHIYSVTAQGDRVALEAEAICRHVSGKLYNNRYHFLFTFRNGKVIEWKEYLDTEMVTDVLLDGRRPEYPRSDEERIAAFRARGKQWPQ